MGWKVPKVAGRVSPSLCHLVPCTPEAVLISKKLFGKHHKQNKGTRQQLADKKYTQAGHTHVVIRPYACMLLHAQHDGLVRCLN